MPRGRAGGVLRKRRVRTRLVALILIPTIAAVLLGGLRIASSLESAVDYTRVQHVAELGEEITRLTQALANERAAMAAYIATGREGNPARVDERQQVVDRRIAAVQRLAEPIDESYGRLVHRHVETVEYRLDQLPALREIALSSKLPPLATIDKYSSIIADLIGVTKMVAEGSSDRGLAANVRAFVAMSRAKEQAARQRDILSVALLTGYFGQHAFDRLVAAGARQDSAITTFKSVASVRTRQLYEDTVTGVTIDEAERFLLTATSRGPGTDLRIDAESWFNAATFKVNRLREVEARLVRALVEESSALSASARRDVVVDSLIVLAVLVLALAATVIVARSMVQPLQALRSGALDVAGRRLPEAVRRLRASPDEHPLIEPIGIGSSDEIGEVAQAFDEVHREAVRLAAEEAQLRGTLSAMFVNLSRRSQTLVERQLDLIDTLEQGEQDPDRLSSFFRLDHLATRMRRNGENLLVLSGQDPPRRWSQPVPLLDVVRASLSEIEQYDRVRLQVQAGVAIAGSAVNDLVHLVAELLDNATSFSPPDTPVMVAGQVRYDGFGSLEIEDGGIGMAAAELAAGNERLARPPEVDVSVFRRMGLFVVGRLAARHAIRVELRPSRGGGVTAQVLLPPGLLTRSAEGQSAHGGTLLSAEAEFTAPQPARVPVEPPPALPPPALPPSGPPTGPLTGPPTGPLTGPTTGPLTGPLTGPPSGPLTGSSGSPGPPTGPTPPVGPTPTPEAPRRGEEGLPIFAAIESEWFQRRNRRSPFRPSPGETSPVTDTLPTEETGSLWASPADEGWRAAQAVDDPDVAGRTAAGLPKRVPGANLVPGSVDVPAPADGGQPAVRSAATVRDRLAGFRRGVEQGRVAGYATGGRDVVDPPIRDGWENYWTR